MSIGVILVPIKDVGTKPGEVLLFKRGKVALEPCGYASDCCQSKSWKPLTKEDSPAILFNSEIKPVVDVSQNISNLDSTGLVSKIPKLCGYGFSSCAAWVTCKEPIGKGSLSAPEFIETVPWSNLAT